MKPYEPKPRTEKQNNALHLFCTWVAEALNNAGWSVQKLLTEKPVADIDWNKDNVKKILWHKFQLEVLGKKSTTELSKQEDIDKVYDHLLRYLTDPNNPAIEETIPWPSETMVSHDNDAKNMANKLRQKEDYPEYVEPTF